LLKRLTFVLSDHFTNPKLSFDLFSLDIPLENNRQPDLRFARNKLLSDIIDKSQEHLWESIKKA
jgi:hypothetical protein